MNIIERQTELGKSLYEINTSTLKNFFSLQRENIEKYIETNREFGTRLPEVKDVSSFVELQREYGETLLQNARAALEAQNELLTHAFSETRDAVKVAFTQEQEAAAEAVVKAADSVKEAAAPKAKAKTKAKAKAKKAANA